MICKYFHIHSNVFLLLLSSLPQNQAEYLVFRKWPVTALLGSQKALLIIEQIRYYNNEIIYKQYIQFFNFRNMCTTLHKHPTGQRMASSVSVI